MKYAITVDRYSCISCGVCYSTDPTHFVGDAEGKSSVMGGTSNGTSMGIFDDGLIDDARRAESSCPVVVISVKE